MRSYPLDLELEVINPAPPRIAMTAEGLAAHPALEASLRESWRLFRAGAPGTSWDPRDRRGDALALDPATGDPAAGVRTFNSRVGL